MSSSPSAGPPVDVERAAVDALLAEAAEAERAGDRATARAAYERALAGAPNGRDGAGGALPPARASQVLRLLARTHMADGDADAALDCLSRALDAARDAGDDAAAGYAMHALAIVHWRLGDADAAEGLARSARACAERAGNRLLLGNTAECLGVIATVRGDYDAARAHQEDGLAQYEALGLHEPACSARNNIGMLQLYSGRWAEAERAFARAAEEAARGGHRALEAQVAVNQAELAIARGALAAADDAARHALAVAERVGEAHAAGQATKALGVVARERGDAAAAAAHLDRAAALALAHANRLLEAEVARERAELARRLGHNRELLQQLNRAHRLFAQLHAERQVADIARRMGRLEDEFVLVARRWGESIEAKDRYTQGHCQRVADLACRVAERAGPDEGFDAQAMFWFRIGALLHDVGKIDIPEAVLNKPGKLTDEEFALMRAHPAAGVAMLADVEFPWDVRPVVESHHERWDGSGYPNGLRGEAIPLTARILCVADVYDALTSVRSYKRAFAHGDAMAIMRKDVGRTFDPRVFAWFEAVMEAGAAAAPERTAAEQRAMAERATPALPAAA